MGHLAKEMKDFDELVASKEEIIAKTRTPRPQRYELRVPEQWRAPRNYPDHEVPKNIPAPDPVAELKAITVPKGFKLNLFAANPMIQNRSTKLGFARPRVGGHLHHVSAHQAGQRAKRSHRHFGGY